MNNYIVFQVLASIKRKLAINIGVQVLYGHMLFISLGQYIGAKTGHIVGAGFIIYATVELFSKGICPFYITTSSVLRVVIVPANTW